jgi:hypothetical protein
VTHSINGQPVPDARTFQWVERWDTATNLEIRRLCQAAWNTAQWFADAGRKKPAPTQQSEGQMYANLVDAVKLLNELAERNKLHLNESEAELLWRLRFVTRIEP